MGYRDYRTLTGLFCCPGYSGEAPLNKRRTARMLTDKTNRAMTGLDAEEFKSTSDTLFLLSGNLQSRFIWFQSKKNSEKELEYRTCINGLENPLTIESLAMDLD
ncbi:hypothetical protein OAK62_04225 [Deltaproteobacteria bacterium]|nr:hypothetical protein [Deltaproteobacteria bacterium]